VTDNVDGVLYLPGDVAALARAMQRLRGDTPLRTRLSANARVRANISRREGTAASMIALYVRVSASSSPPRR